MDTSQIQSKRKILYTLWLQTCYIFSIIENNKLFIEYHVFITIRNTIVRTYPVLLKLILPRLWDTLHFKEESWNK